MPHNQQEHQVPTPLCVAGTSGSWIILLISYHSLKSVWEFWRWNLPWVPGPPNSMLSHLQQHLPCHSSRLNSTAIHPSSLLRHPPHCRRSDVSCLEGLCTSVLSMLRLCWGHPNALTADTYGVITSLRWERKHSFWISVLLGQQCKCGPFCILSSLSPDCGRNTSSCWEVKSSYRQDACSVNGWWNRSFSKSKMYWRIKSKTPSVLNCRWPMKGEKS